MDQGNNLLIRAINRDQKNAVLLLRQNWYILHIDTAQINYNDQNYTN